MAWGRIEAYLREKGRGFRHFLSIRGEGVMLAMIVGSGLLLSFCKAQGFMNLPTLGKDYASVFGTITQSLASIFAIVFSISLVAIQLCSEELSHRLIGLYAWSGNFVVPFVLNLGALVLNWFLLSHLDFCWLCDYGIFWSFVAILSLVPFFIYTIRFLMPGHVVDLLLKRIKVSDVLARNFAEETRYRKKLQPIEDIISNRVRKGDYMTARTLIDKVRMKMFRILLVVNEQLVEVGQ